ncbi:MAG: phosphoglycerate kinase [Candidatus Peregrinibacteria bacterium]
MNPSFRRLSNEEPQKLKGKRAIVRVDFNVPQEDGKILDDSRIKAAIPTIHFLLDRGCSVVILSHLGRPKGAVVEKYRLTEVGKRLEELLQKPVKRLEVCIGEEAREAKKSLKPGEVLLLENTRFHIEETENILSFAWELSEECDFFVEDAFGCVHRAHASTEGISHYLPSMMGFLVEKEFEALRGIFEEKKAPITLVIGGAKIDTKIGVIHNFLKIADNILIGGGLANTFFHAKGYDVKDSLVELDKAELARKILQEAGEEKCRIVLARDVVVAKEISNTAETRVVHRKNGEPMEDGEKILDIGPDSIALFEEIIAQSQTIVWNGPLGLFEYEPFANGTLKIAEAIAKSNATSIVGGGDSIDAIHRFGISEHHFSHISTGGGAMLEFLEGKVLPGISVLQRHVEW